MEPCAFVEEISGHGYCGGLGQYKTAGLGRTLAKLALGKVAAGNPCRINLSGIDSANGEFMKALSDTLYCGDVDFKTVDEKVSVYFGKTEIANYYVGQYRKFVFAAKQRFLKGHATNSSGETVEKVTVVATEFLKMENLTFSWQGTPLYKKAVEILREGKAVRFDMTRKGRMNMDFLHALLIGFYTNKDFAFDEIRSRVSFKWDERNKARDKSLFLEFKDMMAAFNERQRQISEGREADERTERQEEKKDKEVKLPMKLSFDRVTEERKPRRKNRSNFGRRGYGEEEEDYEDWENWR